MAYVCVPLDTRRSTSSAAHIVIRYASGVRAIVERKRWPPGCATAGERVRVCGALGEGGDTHLDELG